MTCWRLVSLKDRNLCFGFTGGVDLCTIALLGGTFVLLSEHKGALALAQ